MVTIRESEHVIARLIRASFARLSDRAYIIELEFSLVTVRRQG